MEVATTENERRTRAMLGAIEARLRTHDDVAAATAAVCEEQLVAYVVASPGRVPTDDALRAHLKAALQAYMVPKQFVLLDALPQAADGSVDRARLPAWRTATPGAGPAAAPPDDRDARIDYLVGLWSSLLDRAVAPADNFFDLGGHSMLAVQMANRVKIDTGVRIQLMTLATQSLAQIAAELPSVNIAARSGLTARLVGNLKGLLRGGRAAGTA